MINLPFHEPTDSDDTLSSMFTWTNCNSKNFLVKINERVRLRHGLCWTLYNVRSSFQCSLEMFICNCTDIEGSVLKQEELTSSLNTFKREEVNKNIVK